MCCYVRDLSSVCPCDLVASSAPRMCIHHSYELLRHLQLPNSTKEHVMTGLSLQGQDHYVCSAVL